MGFGFVVDWLNSGQITYNWERDDRLIGELAIAPQALVEKFGVAELKYESRCRDVAAVRSLILRVEGELKP